MASLAGDIPDYPGGDRRVSGRRATSAGRLEGVIRAGDGKRTSEADNRVPYIRPHFLHLNADEVVASGDKTSRPIILPRDVTKVPWCAGYAEVINAGKSDVNEDQARAERIILKNPSPKVASKKHKSKEPKASKERRSSKDAEASKESGVLKKTKSSKDASPLKGTDVSKEFDDSKEASTVKEVTSSKALDSFDHLNEANILKETDSSKELNDLKDSKDHSPLNKADSSKESNSSQEASPSKEADNSTALDRSKDSNPLNEQCHSTAASLPSDASLSSAMNPSKEYDPSKEGECSPLNEAESSKEQTATEEEEQKEEVKGKDIPASEDDMSFVTVEQEQVTLTYFGIFDGHAGYGAAVLAASSLHYIITDGLLSILPQLLSAKQTSPGVATSDSVDLYSCCVCHCHRYREMQKCTAPVSEGAGNGGPLLFGNKKTEITMEEMVIGAIEKAFQEMDKVIDDARKRFSDSLGGCTALAAIFFMGKMFIANAGDCRAVICRDGNAEPVSFDFTPETERKRLHMMASLFPHLLHNEFTDREFARRPTRRDVGKQLLCREGWMSGWALQTVREEDLRVPVVTGDGKRARLLATIGVTRGFGDHSLRLYDSEIRIKPFLSSVPDVKVIDMNSSSYTENDVLVLASDGLWDVISCQQAALIIQNSLATVEISNPKRYTLAAQDLLMHARGNQQGQWRTVDDVTVFVIPLHCYGNNNSKV